MVSKLVINLEVEKNERKYVFSMPVGAPFGEAMDVAYEMVAKVIDLSKEAIEKSKPQEPVKPELVDPNAN